MKNKKDVDVFWIFFLVNFLMGFFGGGLAITMLDEKIPVDNLALPLGIIALISMMLAYIEKRISEN